MLSGIADGRWSANDSYEIVLKTRLRAFVSVPPRAFKCKTTEHAEITQRNAKKSCAIGTFIRNLTILKIIEIAEAVQQAAKKTQRPLRISAVLDLICHFNRYRF
jgi:hypothetical protein